MPSFLPSRETIDRGRRATLTAGVLFGGATLGALVEWKTRTLRPHRDWSWGSADVDLQDLDLAKSFGDRLNTKINYFEQSPKKNLQYVIMKKRAKETHAPGAEQSRMDFIREVVESSSLPPVLKTILPYVPFQESSFRTSARSSVGALGLWQFMPATAKRYDLINGGKDMRTDFEASTRAAVRYFEDIYKGLQGNEHYKILQSRYRLSDDDLLPYITINAYNAGPDHMKHAMWIMAKVESERSTVDRYAFEGYGGLYAYITNEYRGRYQELQEELSRGRFSSKKRNLYGNHGEHYVYNIFAWRALDQQKQSEGGGVAEKSGSWGQLPDAAVAGGVGAAALVAAFRAELPGILLTMLGKKLAPKATQTAPSALEMLQNSGRRRFFREALTKTAGLVALGGAGGGALNHSTDLLSSGVGRLKNGDLLSTEMFEDLWPEFSLSFASIEPITPENEEEYRQEGIRAFGYARTNFSGFPNSAQSFTFEHGRYDYNQYLGDAAYALYQELGEEVYLSLASHFYGRALSLAECQRDEPAECLAPEGGDAKIAERIGYCTQALEMLRGE